jgi:hypothetical protein
MTDLAEFVSDYMDVVGSPDEAMPTAEEIALAYLEQIGEEGPPPAAMLADVTYYAPELAR